MTQIQISNLTDADVVVAQQISRTTPQETFDVLLHPQSSSTQLFLNGGPVQIELSLHASASNATPARFHLKIQRVRIWKSYDLPKECPWAIIGRKIRKDTQQILILKKRDTARFLSEIPDTVPLSELALAGTHETVSRVGWPVSQCQTLSLQEQLESGARFLDIRLSLSADDRVLTAFHGIVPQFVTFKEILRVAYTFLRSDVGHRETLVMSIKQESRASSEWATAVRHEIQAHFEEMYPGQNWKDAWYLENKIPTLGQVRGKIVLMSRFNPADDSQWDHGREGMGLKPPIWPYSIKEGFEWDCAGTRVRTVDWFDIGSFINIPDKVQGAAHVLKRPVPPLPSSDPSSHHLPMLSIAFLSSASFPFALPSTTAKGFGWPAWGVGFEGVNDRIAQWLLDMIGGEIDRHIAPSRIHRTSLLEKKKLRLSDESSLLAPIPRPTQNRVRGWLLFDYFNDPVGNDIVRLILECNFIGRKSGEEGWP